PHLAQDDAEANRQLRTPVGRVQARLTQEREQVAPVSPQVLGQALVSRVRLGREDKVGQLVVQAPAGHGQAVAADLALGVTVAQIQTGREQFGHPTRESDCSPRRGRRNLVGAPQQVHHPNAIAELRATLVIPYTSTARPYRPRRPSNSQPAGSAAAIVVPKEVSRCASPLPICDTRSGRSFPPTSGFRTDRDGSPKPSASSSDPRGRPRHPRPKGGPIMRAAIYAPVSTGRQA